MSNKCIMIDLETTGISPDTEDLLQIGMLEMTFVENHWVGGRTLNIMQHSNREPETAFARKHMVEMYKRANETPYITPQLIRAQIINFAQTCSMAPPDIKFMGWNAGIFDIPFLVAKGILEPSVYKQVGDKEIRVGDFHYRIYDITGALEFMKNLLGTDSIDDIKKMFEHLEGRHIAELPAGKAHDAIYDCVSQMNFLNDLLLLAKQTWA